MPQRWRISTHGQGCQPTDADCSGRCTPQAAQASAGAEALRSSSLALTPHAHPRPVGASPEQAVPHSAQLPAPEASGQPWPSSPPAGLF